jgi:hypothetical protein
MKEYNFSEYKGDGVITLAECGICGHITTCLVADSSGGEYDGVAFCLPCIQKAFEKFNEMPG